MILETDHKNMKRYAPVPIGNGDLSLMIDYTGSNDKTDPAYSLHRAGFRQQQVNTLLFPFGRITQRFCGNANEIVSWKQSLNTENGLVSSRTFYKNGTELQSEVFCHLEKNILGFRKRLLNSPGSYTFRFECGNAPRMQFTPQEKGFGYSFDGIAEYCGKITFETKASALLRFENHTFQLSTNEKDFTFFICFDDAQIPAEADFETLLAESAEHWKLFHEESFLQLPDPEIMRTYAAAKYHLRITQTKWGMPVGLFNTHFGGRYFAFDEFFCAHALASCGHLSMLKKIIDFRFETLPWARYRASGYYHASRPDARWEWETLENFEEGSLCGHWQDHIFHMAHITMETARYCRASNDGLYLREKGIPILEGCAEFYMNQAIIRMSSGKAIVTKCTDLERFGPGRENAYLTTCAVMITLKLASEFFRSVNYRLERAEEYLAMHRTLRENLPQNEQVYFATPENDQRSVAVLGGIYPYENVMGFDDEKQRRTIFDFMENDAEFGSMYPHFGSSKKLCVWYAGWESIVLSRCGEREKALDVLQNKMEETGSFHQIYELYHANRLPWFGTGEGIFIQAVNELLFPEIENTSPRPPSFWRNSSGRLRNRTGKLLEWNFSSKKDIF